MLIGEWSEDGGQVKCTSENFDPKEANEVLDNILFSANIYGEKRNQRQNVAFTLPIMYLPGYNHCRIYFQFSALPEEGNSNDVPTFLFCSYKGLDDDQDDDSDPEIRQLDQIIWQYFNNKTDQGVEFDRDSFCALYDEVVSLVSGFDEPTQSQ